MAKTKQKCSFCGRGENEVEALVPSPGSKKFICEFCVLQSLDLLGTMKDLTEFERRRYQKKAFELRRLLFPPSTL